MAQGTVTFGAIPLHTGGAITLSRGVQPSKFILRKVPVDALTFTTGSVVFTWPDSATSVVTLPNCAVAEVRNRNKLFREGWMQDVVVLDRRWKWKYSRVSGVFNQRALNGTIQTRDKRNAKQLIELLLDILGESSYTTSDVPTDVYPPICWNRARADLELQWLCDLLGMVVCYKVSTNTITIKKLHDTAGTALAETNFTTPKQTYKPSTMPSFLRVQGDPSILQSKLALEAVGLDTDGQIKTLTNLSYKPAAGWDTQWYDSFAGVAAANRHLAFKSVWKWYRPSAGWDDGDTVTPNSFDDIELLTTCAECAVDPNGVYRPCPPKVTGIFWPLGDKAENTADDTLYAGNFRVIPELGIIEFEHPVIRWVTSLPLEADLDIVVAYRIREEVGTVEGSSEYDKYTKDKAVSASTTATDPRVLCHPELVKVFIKDSAWGASTGNNATALDVEADRYLNLMEATYDFTYADDREYNGILAVDLDGAIAQVRWSCGNGEPALTRIGRFTEFDLYTLQNAQRRAMERLAQMAERKSI